jgi:hypothetical protein
MLEQRWKALFSYTTYKRLLIFTTKQAGENITLSDKFHMTSRVLFARLY